MKAGDGMADGSRSALIVASDDYTDPELRRLRAPASDAQALAAVLRDPGIGGFQVRTLLNEPAHEVSLAVEEFFADRTPDDLLLVHFSCHGVKDEGGELYFATANTRLRRLGATAVAAEFVNRRMSRSRSRRVVLLLDCCYAGAFERGMTARAGAGMAIEEHFGGRGRAVITASSAMEYAFEGDQLADTQELQPSVFTGALVEGLETGEADRDQDGLVGLDELYDYVYDKVRAATPNQTPGKWTFAVQGDLVIARRARPVTTPAPLPAELQEAIGSPFAAVRAAAVQELARLLQGRHAGLALAAKLTLEHLSEDDSRAVSAAATAALGAQAQPAPPQPVPPRLALSATVVDFGGLPLHGKSPERKVRLGNAGSGTLNARAATQASWLELRQVGDELVVGVDTTAVGEHDGVVTVDSDGGSATIRVRARVDPTPLPAPEPAAATHPEAVPAAPERDRPSPQEDAVLPETSQAPVPAAPPVAAPAPTPPLPSIPPVGPATPGQAWQPSDQSKPPGKQRRGLSARARILAGAGVGVVLILLIITIVANSQKTPSSADSVIFQDDFSSRANGWDDAGSNRAGGHYHNGAYRIYAKPVRDGKAEGGAPKSASSVYPSAPPKISITVEAQRITGGQDTWYGIACRADANNGDLDYVFLIGDGHAEIGKEDASGYHTLRGVDTSTLDADAKNSLDADCTGDEDSGSVYFNLYVNGEKVVEWTDDANPLPTGTVGLFVATGPKATTAVEAEFDNFAVTQF
jgi:uncharacterized caspase-like protein